MSDNDQRSGLCLLQGLSLPARFLQLVHPKENGCWQWLGSKRCCGKHKGKRYYYPTYCAKYKRLALLSQQAEAHEPEASYRDDIRIAWLIVLHCQRGDAVECSPAVLAWYEVLGCHPDHVWPRILARRAAMLGTSKVLKFPSPKSSPKKSDEEKSA